MLKITAIDHIVFNVSDVEASAAWYERVLGMERRVTSPESGTGGTRTSMHFGRNKINLRQAAASQDSWFTARSHEAGSADLCILTDLNPIEVVAHFESCSIEVVNGPVRKTGAMGAICSVYVRDPDGSLIEVSSYADVAQTDA